MATSKFEMLKTKEIEIPINQSYKKDNCYTNMGQRCSFCNFTGKGKYEVKK